MKYVKYEIDEKMVNFCWNKKGFFFRIFCLLTSFKIVCPNYFRVLRKSSVFEAIWFHEYFLSWLNISFINLFVSAELSEMVESKERVDLAYSHFWIFVCFYRFWFLDLQFFMKFDCSFVWGECRSFVLDEC